MKKEPARRLIMSLREGSVKMIVHKYENIIPGKKIIAAVAVNSMIVGSRDFEEVFGLAALEEGKQKEELDEIGEKNMR